MYPIVYTRCRYSWLRCQMVSGLLHTRAWEAGQKPTPVARARGAGLYNSIPQQQNSLRKRPLRERQEQEIRHHIMMQFRWSHFRRNWQRFILTKMDRYCHIFWSMANGQRTALHRSACDDTQALAFWLWQSVALALVRLRGWGKSQFGQIISISSTVEKVILFVAAECKPKFMVLVKN
jgi:hypothetical protein